PLWRVHWPQFRETTAEGTLTGTRWCGPASVERGTGNVNTLGFGATVTLAHVGLGTDLDVRVLHHDAQPNVRTVADFGRSRLMLPDEDRPVRHRLTFEVTDRD